ncbi:glycosyltransferase family A protein, partial [Faecalicoccus sp.]|uniref:glycosyltransferase family 2 protein n=1 Tax=Faecalicoccus sp. TaxID=1971758 RepID=UPI00260DD24A
MISILVPVYNVENYLSHCLDSILAQTYKDIEIVMVNDGSTDHSKYIASSYANRYSFIHLYNYENAGISTTRNRLLRHAKGEYVFFVDSDDYIAPQTLQAMMHHMEAYNCDIVCCGYTMDYRFGALYRKVETKKVMTKQEALHSLAENKGMNNYPWGKLYKKKCFSNVSFPEFMRGFEDTYTVFKALCNADTIGCISKRYYHYVQHQGSLTH